LFRRVPLYSKESHAILQFLEFPTSDNLYLIRNDLLHTHAQ
jgi:hypothetical protein